MSFVARSVALGLVLCVTVLLHPGVEPSAAAPVEWAEAPQGCPGGAETSSWSRGPGEYEPTAVFGQDDEAWVYTISGVASAEGRQVFVYDAMSATVHALDGHLRPQSRFGRRGGGPGEFAIPPMAARTTQPPLRYLAAQDSLVYVYDGRSVMGFRADGTFRGLETRIEGGQPGVSTLLAIHPTPHGVLYGYDRTEPRGSGWVRRLETWHVQGDEASLVHEFPLPPLPGLGGMVVYGPREARPLWAVRGTCLIVGDGSAAWLLRVDLRSGQADTLVLPDHRVPPVAPPGERERRTEEMVREGARRLGAELPPIHHSPPSAVWRWSSAIIDPDGHLWVEPWRPPADRRPPYRIVRVAPDGGAHDETLPGVPVAFGEPGVLYVIDRDQDTDETVLVRFSAGGASP